MYLGRTNVLISVPGQQRKVASEGRFNWAGGATYPKRAPPTAFKRNQTPLSRARFGFAAAGQAEPGRTCPSFPAPSAKGLPPFPAGGSVGHQLNLLDHNGRRQGALALTRADPGSPSRGRGGVGPSLPLSLSPPYVTQPRGCRSTPQPGAESVRRPGGPRPNQTAPHPRHYLTGELGGNRD